MNTIKSLRINKGLSQEGLAAISGVSLRTIQRIENGESAPRIQTLQTLSKALEVEIEELTSTFTGDKSIEKEIIRPHWQYSLLNSACYLLFPLIALFVTIRLKNKAREKEKRYFSGLLLIDIIAFSGFSFLFVIAIMFKLNGWAGATELAILAYLGTSLTVGLGSFVLLFFYPSRQNHS